MAYRERVTLEAQGEVARFEELLPQYEAAPEVTRQRIYIETMEHVFSSTSKIMVDSSSGGNMMYLPLDKILERQSSATPAPTRNTLEGLRDSDVIGVNTPPSAGLRSDRFRGGRQ